RGSGNLYTNILNHGSIDADVPGGTLQLFYWNKVNRGIMRAKSEGILRLANVIFDQSPESGGPSGRIIAAADSEVQLASATIRRGRIESEGDGVVTASGSSDLEAVHLDTLLAIPGGAT